MEPSETINIRVYKVLFPDGSVLFESQDHDGRGTTGYESLQSMARYVKSQIANFFHAQGVDYKVQVSIDTRPYHDIAYPKNLRPRRCFPLTDSEASEFWELLNAPERQA